nr:putative capsid protein [Cressdnaviricota sp.]
MPSFRRKNNYISRNNKRQRVGPLWSRARQRLMMRKTKSVGRSGGGITAQHDRQFVYGRKRMPYRKRRIWGRFVKKCGAVALKQCGIRSVVFNKATSFTNTTSQNHGVGWCALYSQTSTSTELNDLNYIGNLENFAANPTSAAGETVQLGTKVYFRSAILDVTIRNTSFTSITLTEDVPLEVDLYQIIVGRIGRDSVNGNFTTIKAFYDIAQADTQIIKGTAGFDVDIDKRGCTPFDLTKALSMFGIKIWKKTKYYLASNQTMTFQVRDPKRHVFFRDKVDGLNNGCNMPGITRFFYIVFKAVPGITIDASNTTESIWMGVTRKYMYKVEGLNEDRSIKITG